MRTSQISSQLADLNSNTHLDLLSETIVIPQMVEFLRVIAEDTIYRNISIEENVVYPELLKLTYSIPATTLCKYHKNGASMVEYFIGANFIEGLDYLKSANNISSFTQKTANNFPLIYYAERGAKKETVDWLVQYYEQHKFSWYVNAIQKWVVKNNEIQLRKELNKNNRPLSYLKFKQRIPVSQDQPAYEIMRFIDFLKEAAMLGNLEAVKALCESSGGKYLKEFSIYQAVEGAVFHDHEHVAFYLFDKWIDNKNIGELLRVFFQMSQHAQWKEPGEVLQDRWFFSKKFTESCIAFICNHKKLSDEEKIILLKFPLLFALKAFKYLTREEFENKLSVALNLVFNELVDKNNQVTLPVRIKNYLLTVDKKIDQLKKITAPPILFEEDLLEAFRENKVIHLTFKQNVRNMITRIVADSPMQITCRFFLKNIIYRAELLAPALFGITLGERAKKASNEKCLVLLEYFAHLRIVYTPDDLGLYASIKNPTADADAEFNLVDEDKSIAAYFYQHPHLLFQFTDDYDIQDPIWGYGPKKNILFLDNINKFVLYLLSLNDPEKKQLFHHSLFQYCELLGMADPIFFPKINTKSVEQFLLHLYFVCIDYGRLEFIPATVYPTYFQVGTHVLPEILPKSLPQGEVPSDIPLAYKLISLCFQFIDILDFSYAFPENNRWYKKGTWLEQLYKTAYSCILQNQQYTELNKERVGYLTEIFQKFPLENMSVEENDYQGQYVKDLTMLCQLLFQWTKTNMQPTTKDADALELLHLKKLVLSTVQYFINESLRMFITFMNGGLEFLSKLRIVQTILRAEISDTIKETEQSIKKIQRGMFAALYVIDSNYEKVPKSILPATSHVLNQFTRLSPRFFVGKTESYEKIRSFEALNLPPSALQTSIRFCCNVIANLYEQLKNHYREKGDKQLVFNMDTQINFYRNPNWYLTIPLESHEQTFWYVYQAVAVLLHQSIFAEHHSYEKEKVHNTFSFR